eukprot:6193779-Pleurochrysis_carterae.AAC.2
MPACQLVSDTATTRRTQCHVLQRASDSNDLSSCGGVADLAKAEWKSLAVLSGRRGRGRRRPNLTGYGSHYRMMTCLARRLHHMLICRADCVVARDPDALAALFSSL